MNNDYVKVYPLDINLEKIRESCDILNQYINSNFDQVEGAIATGPLTTRVFNHYNLLLFPYDEFHKLYQEICRVFSIVCNTDKNYYIQCWLNYCTYEQFIDWHSHWGSQDNTWHGFVCVDSEDSITSYRLPSGEEFDVPSKNGTLIISRSNGDVHRTYPWPHADRPRITIAFDCVPEDRIQWGVNHWIPVAKLNHL